LLTLRVFSCVQSLMVLQDLIEDLVLDVSLECHRAFKRDTPLCHRCGQPNCTGVGAVGGGRVGLCEEPGKDIFGNVPDVNHAELTFPCDHCRRYRFKKKCTLDIYLIN